LLSQQVSTHVTELVHTKQVKWRDLHQISTTICYYMVLWITNTWNRGNIFSFHNPWVVLLAWIPKVDGPIYKFQVWYLRFSRTCPYYLKRD
jgi:hypothetical protein